MKQALSFEVILKETAVFHITHVQSDFLSFLSCARFRDQNVTLLFGACVARYEYWSRRPTHILTPVSNPFPSLLYYLRADNISPLF